MFQVDEGRPREVVLVVSIARSLISSWSVPMFVLGDVDRHSFKVQFRFVMSIRHAVLQRNTDLTLAVYSQFFRDTCYVGICMHIPIGHMEIRHEE